MRPTLPLRNEPVDRSMVADEMDSAPSPRSSDVHNTQVQPTRPYFLSLRISVPAAIILKLSSSSGVVVIVSRRSFGAVLTLAAAATSTATPAYSTILGDGIPEPFPEGVEVPTLSQLADAYSSETGALKPLLAEVENAKRIIESVVADDPIGVAQYIASLADGSLNEYFQFNSASYVEEWPLRANPLIVGFFEATRLRKPNGDITPWCAAFVSWCIARSKRGSGADQAQLPRTAASADFRNWGAQTTDPKYGDLVVFVHKRRPDNGHVGFYVEGNTNGFFILGGNQMPFSSKSTLGTWELPNKGEVNVKWFNVSGKDLELHSFRTSSILR